MSYLPLVPGQTSCATQAHRSRSDDKSIATPLSARIILEENKKENIFLKEKKRDSLIEQLSVSTQSPGRGRGSLRPILSRHMIVCFSTL